MAATLDFCFLMKLSYLAYNVGMKHVSLCTLTIETVLHLAFWSSNNSLMSYHVSTFSNHNDFIN